MSNVVGDQSINQSQDVFKNSSSPQDLFRSVSLTLSCLIFPGLHANNQLPLLQNPCVSRSLKVYFCFLFCFFPNKKENRSALKLLSALKLFKVTNSLAREWVSEIVHPGLLFAPTPPKPGQLVPHKHHSPHTSILRAHAHPTKVKLPKTQGLPGPRRGIPTQPKASNKDAGLDF